MPSYPYLYAVIQWIPCLSKRERVNIGILLLLPETGEIKLSCAPQPTPVIELLSPGSPGYEPTVKQLIDDCTSIRFQNAADSIGRFHTIIAPREQSLQFSTARSGKSIQPVDILLKTLFSSMVTL